MKKIVNGQEVDCTPEEIAEINATKAAKEAERLEYEATEKYKDQRKKEYPSDHDLLVALWERVVENRPEASDALQVQREEVKAKYPKPVV